MKTSVAFAIAASFMASMGSAQSSDSDNAFNIGGIAVSQDAVMCLSSCSGDVRNLANLDTMVTCGNQTLVNTVYSCIQSSNCDSSDKPKASSLISSICALGSSAASEAGLETSADTAATMSSPAANAAATTSPMTTGGMGTSSAGGMTGATSSTPTSSESSGATATPSPTGAAPSLRVLGGGVAGLGALGAVALLL